MRKEIILFAFLAVLVPFILSGAQQVADAARAQVGKWPYSWVNKI